MGVSSFAREMVCGAVTHEVSFPNREGAVCQMSLNATARSATAKRPEITDKKRFWQRDGFKGTFDTLEKLSCRGIFDMVEALYKVSNG